MTQIDTNTAGDMAHDDLGTLHFAGWVVMLNGALHVLAPVFGGFNQMALGMAGWAVVLFAIGYGMLRGQRWLAWPMFLIALVGSLVAYASMGSGAVPEWLSLAIIAADVTIIAVLFVHIWRR